MSHSSSVHANGATWPHGGSRTPAPDAAAPDLPRGLDELRGSTRSSQRIVARAALSTRRRAIAARPTPVVVFDLDGTLIDNRPRTRVDPERARPSSWRDVAPELAARLAARRTPSELAYLAHRLARAARRDRHRASRRSAGVLARPLLRRRAPPARRGAPGRASSSRAPATTRARPSSTSPGATCR